MEVVTLRVVTLADATPVRQHGRTRRRVVDPYRVPPVDWTGHQYKAPIDCKVDYAHVGREVMRGRDTIRTMPMIPGRWNRREMER